MLCPNRSPLQAFAGPEQDHLEVVRLLLAAGADALANAKGGHSPLDIVLNRAMEDVLELMLATVYGKKNQKTNFDLAITFGPSEQLISALCAYQPTRVV